jgi:hypothetical protein
MHRNPTLKVELRGVEWYWLRRQLTPFLEVRDSGMELGYRDYPRTGRIGSLPPHKPAKLFSIMTI